MGELTIFFPITCQGNILVGVFLIILEGRVDRSFFPFFFEWTYLERYDTLLLIFN
jgi:hypothetical protein